MQRWLLPSLLLWFTAAAPTHDAEVAGADSLASVLEVVTHVKGHAYAPKKEQHTKPPAEKEAQQTHDKERPEHASDKEDVDEAARAVKSKLDDAKFAEKGLAKKVMPLRPGFGAMGMAPMVPGVGVAPIADPMTNLMMNNVMLNNVLTDLVRKGIAKGRVSRKRSKKNKKRKRTKKPKKKKKKTKKKRRVKKKTKKTKKKKTKKTKKPKSKKSKSKKKRGFMEKGAWVGGMGGPLTPLGPMAPLAPMPVGGVAPLYDPLAMQNLGLTRKKKSKGRNKRRKKRGNKYAGLMMGPMIPTVPIAPMMPGPVVPAPIAGGVPPIPAPGFGPPMGPGAAFPVVDRRGMVEAEYAEVVPAFEPMPERKFDRADAQPVPTPATATAVAQAPAPQATLDNQPREVPASRTEAEAPPPLPLTRNPNVDDIADDPSQLVERGVESQPPAHAL